MEVSRLDKKPYDYSFKKYTGFVKHKALNCVRLLEIDKSLQGSLDATIKVYGVEIPFKISGKGLVKLRKEGYKVTINNATGLRSLKNLDTVMTSIVSKAPNVTV